MTTALDPPAVVKAADRLAEATRTGVPCPPVRDLFDDGGDLVAAYAVQQRYVRRGQAEGYRVVGRTIGLTSVAVQRQLGVDRPDFGALFADMAVPDGGEVPPGGCRSPRWRPRARSSSAVICRTASALSSTCCARSTSRCPRWRSSRWKGGPAC